MGSWDSKHLVSWDNGTLVPAQFQARHAAERQPSPAELLRGDRLGASLEEALRGGTAATG